MEIINQSNTRQSQNIENRQQQDYEDLNNHLSQNLCDLVKLSNLQQSIIITKHIIQTPQAQKMQQIYQKFRILRKISLILLFSLSFFQKPIWCTSEYIENCQKKINDPDLFIPNSNIPFIENSTYYPLQTLLILFLTCNKMIKHQFLKPSILIQRRYNIMIGLTLVILVANILAIIFPGWTVDLEDFLVPIYFVMYNGNLRRTFKLYISTIQKGLPILFAMVLNIFFFAAIGKFMFRNFDDDQNYFNNFSEACFNLFILQTTSNFPDVMMPFIIRSKGSALFFVLFLLINNILLLNMIIGVFFFHYKNIRKMQTQTFFIQQKEFINKIQQKSTIFSDNIDKIDSNLQNLIKMADMNFKDNKYQYNIIQKPLLQNQKYSDKLTQNVQNYQQYQNFLQNNLTQLIIGLLSILNFLYVYFEIIEIENNKLILTIMTLCINTFFLTLDILQQYISDQRNYYYIYEFIISLSIEIIFVIGLSFSECNQNSICVIVEYLLITRLLRLIIILFQVKIIKQIYGGIFDLIPYFADLFGALIFSFFLFAALGMHIFGGKYNSSQQYHIQAPPEYIHNNFNDLASSFILLFELLIVNNWNVNAAVGCTIMGSNYYRIYFISWYIISVLLCLSIFIAFIIDILVQKQGENEKNNQLVQNNDYDISRGNSIFRNDHEQNIQIEQISQENEYESEISNDEDNKQNIQ